MAAHGENQVGTNAVSSAYAFRINGSTLKHTYNGQSTISRIHVDNFNCNRN